MTVGSFVGCSDVQCATHGSRSGHARAAQCSTAEKRSRSVNEQRLSPVRHYARRAHRQMMADWRKKDGSDGRRDFLRICNVFLNRARPSQVSTCTGRTYPLPLGSPLALEKTNWAATANGPSLLYVCHRGRRFLALFGLRPLLLPTALKLGYLLLHVALFYVEARSIIVQVHKS